MARRCPWGTSHPLYLTYHDDEWGVPLHDDQRLFEMLVLEGSPGRLELAHRAQEARALSTGVLQLRPS